MTSKEKQLRLALQGMLDEWDRLTKYGSPMAKSANERVAFARAVLGTTNVVELKPKAKFTTDDLPAEQVLERAISAELRHVLVLGYNPDWSEYFAGSSSDVTANAWLCQRFTFKQLIAGEDD